MKSSRAVPTQNQENLSWSWIDKIEDPETEISLEEVLSVYRVNYPEHSFVNGKRCKKNCKSNPRCYSALGEQKWLEAKKTANETEEIEPQVTSEYREDNLPAGLINLGNTCYVNSFLQIWFNNMWLRRALYSWVPHEDPEECDNKTLVPGSKFLPLGKVGSLQVLFALMEFSPRKALDPNDFVTKLGLDPLIQQDAQEFSKLFMSLLESCLASQTNEEVKKIVQNQFCGEYAYITTCLTCGRESRRPSLFYELVLIIQGKKSLIDCLQDYLGEEELTGDNKYYCESCDSKEDAIRCTRLTKLPPVLNLSLNRFIFDMKSGSRKKLNSAINFPEELDMSIYLGKDSGSLIYNLTGILIHIGDNAHQGHYKAHVQDLVSGEWFQYSDTVVESLQGFESQLGSEVEVESGKTPKKSRSKNPGSTTAYMLVYTATDALLSLKQESINGKQIKNGSKPKTEKQKELSHQLKTNGKPEDGARNGKKHRFLINSDKGENIESVNGENESKRIPEIPRTRKRAPAEISNCSGDATNGAIKSFPKTFPDHLVNLVEHDRTEFFQEIEDTRKEKETATKEREFVSTTMTQVLSTLSFTDGSTDFEFLPSDWLKTYISKPRKENPLNTSQYLCMHGRLDFDKLTSLKVINKTACETILFQTGLKESVHRLTSAALCFQCVKSRCRQMKLSARSMRDAKLVQELAKESVASPSEESFWVGKGSLKRWRTLAKENLEDQITLETGQFFDDQTGEEEFSVNGKTSEEENVENVTTTNQLQTQFKNQRIQEEQITSQSTKSEDEKENQFEDAQMESDGELNSKDDAEQSELVLTNTGVAAGARLQFNSDIICLHGGLCVEISKRRVVSNKVWKILREYFPNCPEFKSDSPPCTICEVDLDKVKSESKCKQDLAQIHKSSLADILNEKNRPTWSKQNLNKVYLVSRNFVNGWRYWVRNPSVCDPITTLGNESLLCEHRKLAYPLNPDTEADEESVVYMVSEEEWKTLSHNFDVDCEILVTRNRESLTEAQTGETIDSTLFVSSPDVCWDCVDKRVKQEQDDRLVYQNSIVYIRKLTGSEKPPEEDPTDPDFTEGNPISGNAPKRLKLGNNCGVRRSNRRQKVRGEKEISVSSDMLLKDLKVKIMKAFSVAPFDQNLCINGVYLTDSSKTLAQLRVFPMSTIYLTVDEPNPGATEEPMNQDPEEGFKGTGLVSNSL